MKMTSANDLKVYEKLQSDLSPGENVLWVGRPRDGVVFRASDFFVIPFSLVWTGFAVFWEMSAYALGAPLFFLLFGVPFLIIGLYLIVGRFFYEYYQRQNSSYAVTKSRVILKQDIFPKSTKSLALAGLGVVELAERAGGVGDITFQDPATVARSRNRSQPPRFDNIPDAAAVYRLIVEAQADARKDG